MKIIEPVKPDPFPNIACGTLQCVGLHVGFQWLAPYELLEVPWIHISFPRIISHTHTYIYIIHIYIYIIYIYHIYIYHIYIYIIYIYICIKRLFFLFRYTSSKNRVAHAMLIIFYWGAPSFGKHPPQKNGATRGTRPRGESLSRQVGAQGESQTWEFGILTGEKSKQLKSARGIFLLVSW